MNDPAPVETPQEWIRYAEGDLGVAEREFRFEEPAYHTICFLCQSSAEKFLKAYLLSMGWELEKTHDLLTLLNRCARYASQWNDLSPQVDKLNDYITAGRYPGDLSIEHIGKPEAEEALHAARQIRARVMTAMGRE